MADPVKTHWHTVKSSQVRDELAAPVAGLSSAEVEQRLAVHGRNELQTKGRDPWYLVFLRQFRSPMILFLLLAAVITMLLQEWFDTIVILFTLTLNAIIGFWQERKADSDVRALQQLNTTEATVVRAEGTERIDAAVLVPGDTVKLESGDKVPADLRLVDANGLQIDESMLTGESLPSSKRDTLVAANTPMGDRVNMCFSGTLVVSGRATALVVATGTNTELGEISELVQGDGAKTPLEILTDRLEKFIGGAVIGIASLLFIASILIGTAVSEAFRTTVALIVSAMPEALPIVLSVAMGVGVSRMAKHNAVVRKLQSVETLGSTTIIGSDKTGTLTVNRMTVEQLWTPDGNVHSFDKSGVAPAAGSSSATATPSPLTDLQRSALRTGALANEAAHKPGDEDDTDALFGDAVDVAMASVAVQAGALSEAERSSQAVAEMPYEPELAYSQAVYLEGDEYVLHVKGAPETIAGFCEFLATADGAVPFDRRTVDRANAEMADQGLRVIATASATLDAADFEALRGRSLPQPRGLTLTGLQGMMDPPRPGVQQAIADCRSAGIHVMMITGDHPATAHAIGKRLGLAGGLEPLTGAQMSELGDLELIDRLRRTSVAARMSPQDKLRIVKVLQGVDQTVAITGDGVNDAPALKAASIGVAMGESGTDVARESADVVLTDDNFVTIVEAVRQGRVTFASIRKATFFLLSNAIAALLAVAVNTFTDLPLIFLPAMLLLMNVVTNGIQDIALSFEKGEGDELTQRPRPKSEGVLDGTMWLRTAITGIWMGVGTLIVYRLAHSSGLPIEHARTLALITMVMFNFFQVFNARSERQSLFTLNPFGNPLLLISAIVALVLQWGATVWPVSANLIGLHPLSFNEWMFCTAVGATVLVLVEIDKFIRRRLAARSL
ncbi:MAG: cation-translocating P-type ATPase [Gulosibacter sp.]|uniref:cation-translocating P-type ATPase n=1 Tax=Gulosibacter sp. TaxID=2817531 RepID=UPI003F90C075